jgi:hypothetical protein
MIRILENLNDYKNNILTMDFQYFLIDKLLNIQVFVSNELFVVEIHEKKNFIIKNLNVHK